MEKVCKSGQKKEGARQLGRALYFDHLQYITGVKLTWGM